MDQPTTKTVAILADRLEQIAQSLLASKERLAGYRMDQWRPERVSWLHTLADKGEALAIHLGQALLAAEDETRFGPTPLK